MSSIDLDFETDIVRLPEPVLPPCLLQAALQARRSFREFRDEPLSLEALSALLWAAAGVNRQAEGRRTAPSAQGGQEVQVYAVTADGARRYDAADHRLLPVAAGDLRASTGEQAFAATAALNLVYVADFERMSWAAPEDRAFLGSVSAGAMAQNAYLAAAALGLGCVLRALVDRRHLAATLRLGVLQRVLLAQTIGFAKTP